MSVYRVIGSLVLSVLLLSGASAHAQAPPPDEQIAAAVKAAPTEKQADATVKGYNSDGELVTLREGDNEIICLADEPGDDRFHVACYHEDLEPFMQRGRALRAEGHSGAEVDSIRQDEIEAGTLPMPKRPMSLYSLTGPADSYDAAADSIHEATPLYVVYTPFATGEQLGLPTRPEGKMPWLMDAGAPWAHIMITPGNEE